MLTCIRKIYNFFIMMFLTTPHQISSCISLISEFKTINNKQQHLTKFNIKKFNSILDIEKFHKWKRTKTIGVKKRSPKPKKTNRRQHSTLKKFRMESNRFCMKYKSQKNRFCIKNMWAFHPI